MSIDTMSVFAKQIYPVRLGACALEHIRTHLQLGNTLSKQLMHTLNFATGEIFTLMPRNANEKFKTIFNEGGLFGIYNEFVPNLNHMLSELIFEYIKKTHGIVILENVLAKPSDPVLTEKEDLYVSSKNYGSEVYHVFDKKIRNQKIILETINRAANSWQCVGCFSSEMTVKNIDGKVLSNVQFEQIVENIKGLFVGAYDGESFIFWVPPGSPLSKYLIERGLKDQV